MGPVVTETRLHLRLGVQVGLTSHGWLLPGRRGEDPLALDASALALLVAASSPRGLDPEAIVAEVAAASGHEPEALAAAWDRLRGRLPLGPEPLRSRPDPEVLHPAPASTSVDPSARWQVPVPITLGVTADGLRWVDPASGATLALDETMVAVAESLVRPRTVPELTTSAAGPAGDADPSRLAEIVSWLVSAGMAVMAGPEDVVMGTSDVLRREELDRNRAVFRIVADREAHREPAVDRTAVVPVCYPAHIQPTALGLILSYAQTHEGGRLAERYDLDPRWHVSMRNIERVLAEVGPAVFLFSDYVWSSDRLLAISRRVKELSPQSITVHGGPDVPRHAADLAAWMAANPHVDVAVRNEGELTVAELLTALDGRVAELDGDLSVLAGVAGLTYRSRDGELVRTGDRDRIADLDVVPSPFLNGLFDPWAEAGTAMAVLETNRGCPYGCTFCDWGSATLSRIRKFSLERVFGELEWVGRAKATRLQVADANFGIFPRDVEIAEKLAAVRREYGYPREVFISFAKNTTKYTAEIIRILVDAGAITTGVISLQTTDPDTLEAVHRKNIRTDKYHELARVFREERLPLIIDMMYGLPGQTPQGFRGDLQHCVDIEVPPRLYRTEVLVNSPMNDPSYREQWGIHTEEVYADEPLDLKRAKRRRRLILSSSTFTAEELDDMTRLGDTFGILENYGLARHLGRWLRQRIGLAEIDLYGSLDRVAVERPADYPALWAVLETMHSHTAVPQHWSFLIDDLRRFVTDELGLPDDSELETVLRVQEALLPARGRQFPHEVDLPHDYPAWHEALIAVKESGVVDWVDRVPPLSTFGPATFVVDDPHDVCRGAMGSPMDIKLGDNWELVSSVSRSNLAYRRA